MDNKFRENSSKSSFEWYNINGHYVKLVYPRDTC